MNYELLYVLEANPAPEAESRTGEAIRFYLFCFLSPRAQSRGFFLKAKKDNRCYRG